MPVIVQLHHPFPPIVLYQHLLCPSMVLLIMRLFVQTRKLGSSTIADMEYLYP